MELENRKEKLALIHVARKELSMDDIAYRALLEGAAGIQSSAEIKTVSQFDAIMRSFGILGFKRKPPLNKHNLVNPEEKGLKISEGQIHYIRGLWKLASRSKSEEGLNKLIQRIGHVDNIRFLDKKSASAVILTLKDICRKAGFDPERKGRIQC